MMVPVLVRLSYLVIRILVWFDQENRKPCANCSVQEDSCQASGPRFVVVIHYQATECLPSFACR